MTKSYYQKIEEKTQQIQTQNEFSSLCKGKPFYIWDRKAHKKEYDRTKALYGKPRCCFNHIIPIGLPKKHDKSMPLFDYEKEIYDALDQHKHVWIKKATGLGITEFM